jgi:hypothetical protein
MAIAALGRMIACGGETARGTTFFRSATIGPSTDPETRKITGQISRQLPNHLPNSLPRINQEIP